MIAEATILTPLPDNSPAERALFIGSSDAAPAIGVSPWKTALQLWLEKRGEAEPEPENDAMHLGKLLEPVVLSMFTRRTGNRVLAHQQRFIHPEYPWMACTVDGLTDDGTVVEAKTANWRVAEKFGEEGTDAIPEEYVIQTTHAMAVTGANLAIVPVLLGGDDLRIYRVERNDGLIAVLIEREQAFWRMVQEGRAPEPDWEHETTNQVLNAMYEPQGGTVHLDDQAVTYFETYWQAKRAEAAAQKVKKTAKAHLLALMGHASCAMLPNGSKMTRKKVDVAEQARAAYSYNGFWIGKEK